MGGSLSKGVGYFGNLQKYHKKVASTVFSDKFIKNDLELIILFSSFLSQSYYKFRIFGGIAKW